MSQSVHPTFEPDELLRHPNITAFLKTIRRCEGTASADGYRMLFGGQLSESFAAHPHRYFSYTNKAGETIRTSAAGAYQITFSTWSALQLRLRLSDFSPRSQDIAALYLIEEHDALQDVLAGNVAAAVEKLHNTWASLPGNNAHQPQRGLEEVIAWYRQEGGQLRA
jgi:lysozyme